MNEEKERKRRVRERGTTERERGCLSSVCLISFLIPSPVCLDAWMLGCLVAACVCACVPVCLSVCLSLSVSQITHAPYTHMPRRVSLLVFVVSVSLHCTVMPCPALPFLSCPACCSPGRRWSLTHSFTHSVSHSLCLSARGPPCRLHPQRSRDCCNQGAKGEPGKVGKEGFPKRQ